jgi:hypothetical protein
MVALPGLLNQAEGQLVNKPVQFLAVFPGNVGHGFLLSREVAPTTPTIAKGKMPTNPLSGRFLIFFVRKICRSPGVALSFEWGGKVGRRSFGA